MYGWSVAAWLMQCWRKIAMWLPNCRSKQRINWPPCSAQTCLNICKPPNKCGTHLRCKSAKTIGCSTKKHNDMTCIPFSQNTKPIQPMQIAILPMVQRNVQHFGILRKRTLRKHDARKTWNPQTTMEWTTRLQHMQIAMQLRHKLAMQTLEKIMKINQKQWWDGAHRVLSNHKVDSTYVNCYTFNCQPWNAKPPPAPNHPYPCEEENRVFRLLGTNFGF